MLSLDFARSFSSINIYRTQRSVERGKQVKNRGRIGAFHGLLFHGFIGLLLSTKSHIRWAIRWQKTFLIFLHQFSFFCSSNFFLSFSLFFSFNLVVHLLFLYRFLCTCFIPFLTLKGYHDRNFTSCINFVSS